MGSKTIVVDGVNYGSDCTALVRAAFARAGHPFPPEARDARSMLEVADRRGAVQQARSASAGDLVFLADRPGGPAAHVAIVMRAEPDGTLTVLHRVTRGVRHVRMNLAYPERTSDPSTGKHINDLLRVQARPEPAGRLVVAVSDLLRRA
jgi:cell wall-associated NlpC family hydrolase